MVAPATAAAALACVATATAAAPNVRVGDTEAQVAAILGHNPVLCTAKISRLCKNPVYLFLDGTVDGRAAGIGVQFRRAGGVERVSRIFRFKASR
ncbi:MAG TPA: hypothetical protein VGL76_03760 [Gaiellaceae bacterium]